MTIPSMVIETSLFNSGVSVAVGALIVGFVGASAFFWKPRIEDQRIQNREKRAFINQCFDYLRHFIYSADALREIICQRKCDGRLFSQSHLRKICFLPKSDRFSHDLYKLVPFEIAGEMQHMKLRLRNISIDIDEANKIYEEGSIDDVYEEVLFLAEQLDGAVAKTVQTLRKLGVNSAEIDKRVGRYKNAQSRRHVRFFSEKRKLKDKGETKHVDD